MSERDLEESDEALEALEGEQVDFWEKRQREVLTNTLDYSIGTLSDFCDARTIDLSPKYQRRFRWGAERQSRLIESFLMNVPVPPIFLNEDKYGKYSVIDGKQRLLAINSFLNNNLALCNLKVFSDINGMTFRELPETLQTVIRTRPSLRTIIVLRQSDSDVKFEVFRRLNTGGVQLNNQEIRNSTYPGPFNDALLELSGYPLFHQMLGIKENDESTIYKEMRDVELVLRYFAFRDSWQSFSGSMNRYMDHFMEKGSNLSAEEIKMLKEDFVGTLGKVYSAFGSHAFQRYRPDRGKWQERVVVALFDAEMFACKDFKIDQLRNEQARLIESLSRLFDNPEFQSSLRSFNPTTFRKRVEIVRSMIEGVVRGRSENGSD